MINNNVVDRKRGYFDEAFGYHFLTETAALTVADLQPELHYKMRYWFID